MRTMKITEKLYWIGKRDGTDFMQFNSYLLLNGQDAILIDPCPRSQFKESLKALLSLVDVKSIKYIILHHHEPDVISSLSDWENAGFVGSYIAHWRTAMFLPGLNLKQRVISINKNNTRFFDGEFNLDFIPTPYLNSPGAMITCEPESEVLFSGNLFNTYGFEKSRLWYETEDFIKLAMHLKYYMPSSFILHSVLEKLEKLSIKMILPHHGYMIKDEIDSIISKSGNLRCGALLELSENKNLLTVYENLHNNLKGILSDEELRVLENERMKDSLTGFYNEKFFLNFIKSFSDAGNTGVLLFIKIDDMEKINEQFSTEEGDRTISIFSQVLLNMEIEKAVFFRLNGPACICLIPEILFDEGVSRAEDIRNEFEKSDLFISSVTVSVAIVDLSEINGAALPPAVFAEKCLVTGKKRINILDKMGPSSICTTSRISFMETKKGVVLILNEDRFEAEVLKEFLEKESLTVYLCHNGNEALRFMDIYKPGVVLSELYLPQLSAFQIRRRMLNSSDLDTIPMVLISHRKNESSVSRSIKLEIFHYLRKPVYKNEVIGIIMHLLDRRQSLI